MIENNKRMMHKSLQKSVDNCLKISTAITGESCLHKNLRILTRAATKK